VEARYAGGSSLTGTGLTLGALSTGAAHAAAVAGAGGLLVAGSGAEAKASDTTNVTAVIGAGARANVGTGTIGVSATASPDAKAAAFGVAVAGGLAVGAAIAEATVGAIVRSEIEHNTSLIANQFTAGQLSLTATGSVFGTAAGDAVRLSDATSGFARGGYSAAASAVAGSGSYYVSAVGTDAKARNTTSVTASLGDYIGLSSGSVTVSATNTTLQAAKATGITIAGTAAIGRINAEADAETTTTASFGASSTMAGSGTGRFTLTATGEDTQIARAEAGSGGLYAGSGAEGSTSNTSDVTASLGANAVIVTGLATIGASHSTRYAALVDSLQAAALGASAALAKNTANVDVLTELGAGARITAAGPGTNGCYLTSCLQAISLTSRNAFTQLELGDSVRAAAGGGINGAGATSRTGIDGTSKVELKDGVVLIGGTSPTAAPGSILAQAWSELFGDDTATLTTGGLLQGAGVSARYRAGSAQDPLTNTVKLGNNVVLTSFGAINLGTYTLADVTANAYVSTYGLAGVGLADADVTIRTDNKVLIGTDSELIGLYDVNVTAGRDGADARRTTLSGTANALGYVRGLIAVPDADASTDLQHHARVEVGSGTRISSAQNVTLGAYEGVLDAEADGTGHGYQLYFIPVTTGSSSPGRSSSSTLVMNGTATAGIYNTQRIEIGCGANASVQCGPNENPTISFVSGAPVTASLTSTFDPVAYINARYEAAVASTLISGVNAAPVKAIRLSQLYAAGGNVFVSAGTVQGNGSLVARGGPSITVINRSNAYLVLDGGAYIPQSSGGQIIGSTGTLARSANPDATPSIIIDNAYIRPLDPGDKGPALLIGGDITNLSGLVSINNTLGSFGFSGQRIDSLQFNITVPNGVVAVSSNGPNGMYNAGGSPQGEYNHAIYYPGGTPGSGPLDVNQAVIAAANALATAAGYGNNINYFLYGRQDEGATRNWSLQFFGNCAGYIADSGANCTGDYNMGRGINFYALPTIPTYRESNPGVAGSAPKIFGAQVAIKATTININASIEAGRITNWSGTVDAGMAASLRNQRQYYLDRGYVEVGLKEALGGTWANAGAAPVYYDLVNDRLVLWDVNASSGGGSVLLDGQIISTNTLGSIKINGGFGDVSLNNTSGLDLVVNRVNTGTGVGVAASVSKITIVDRLITSGPNTTVYAYTPGSGIAKYITHNGAQPILSGAGASVPVEFISGDLTRHETVAGTRYEWTQQALLQKVGLTEDNRNQANIPGVYWRFDSGTSSNPWVYVDAQSPSTDPGEDPRFWWSRDAQAPSAELVSGRVVTGKTGLTHVGMTQEITGGHLNFIHNQASYGGCNGQAINHCDYDFVAKAGETQAKWDYNYATRAFVQVTTSVKADNPFAISFAGNAAGRVNITSNSSVLQNGTIVNPSGTTTIIASGGSFTQTNNATILSNDLNLSARDSIGTQTTAIKATLTAGAQLNATAGSGGINLDITGSARVVALRADQNSSAYGDVRVQATGSLEAVATGAPNVVGRNITLVSEEGSIGSTSTLMQMRAVATQLPNGSHVDGVVNIRARGDVGIAQTVGDLRVGQIASAAGNVRIDVNAGRLVSASGQTAAQALSAEQLSQVSRALKLTAADGAGAAAQASVAAFEKQVTQSYGLYTALMRNGEMKQRTVNGVSRLVFTLNEDAIALYQAFADAAVGGTATEQQVIDYAESRYAAYAGVFEKAYGSGWASQARFNPATAENNFSFSVAASDAAPNLESRITGDAVWTERQLVSAINKSALEPASGVVGNGTALVIGRDITLNTAGSIGSLAPDVQVALSDIRNGTISNAQLAALAVATTAGSVKIIGQRQDGSLVEVTDLNNVPVGVTLSRVDVKQTAPLFINASGTFSGSAQGDVYVQATGTPQAAGGTLTIGRITATGTVSLQAPQSIAVGTQADGTTPRSPVQIQTGGDLVLVAGGGSIGSAATPLTYQIGGRLVSASAAAGDVHLVAKGGDAQIGRVFASGTVSLTALEGGIQGYLPGVAISARSILLNAAGNAGSAGARLGLQVGAMGEVSGQIGGSAWLSAPAVGGQPATPLRIGEFSATSGIDVTADDEIRILRNLRSSSGAVSVNGNKIAMASGADLAGAGRVSLASASDIELGRVTSSWAPPAGSASILIAAAGAILGNGDSGTLLGAAGTGGMIDLRAGTGIGSAAAALTFASPFLSASSITGDVVLAASGTTRVASLVASSGAAVLSASGDLTVDTVTTGGGAHITATAGTLDLASLTAGASSTLSASGTVTLGDATTTAGDLTVTSTAGGLSLAGLDSAGKLTLTAATSIAVTGALHAGDAVDATAQNGTLTLASLSAGGATSLEATGLISLASATTTIGSFSAVSSGAGMTAGTIAAATGATLNAAGPIAITTALTAGEAANVTTTAGTLNIASLTAGAGSTLSASGTVTLGDAITTAGDLTITSTAGGLSLAGLDSAGKLTLTAAASIAVTGALHAGDTVDATAQNGALTLAGLSAGGATSLEATGLISLASATTSIGSFSAVSSGAGITAGTIAAATGATLTAAGPIALTTALTAGEAANVTTTAGTLSIASLMAGASSVLSAAGTITLGDATTTAGNLDVTSTGASLSLAGLDVAGDLTLTATTSISATGSLLAGGTMAITSQNGALSLARLESGGATTLDATGAIGLASATSTAGLFSARSHGAGITAGTIAAAITASLIAGGPIAVTTALTAGEAANVTTTAGTITIASLTAGASSTLSASGTVALGEATTAAGDLTVTSTGADLALADLDSASKLTLSAATSITATGALLAGDAMQITAQNGTLTLASLSAGGVTSLEANGLISLTSATTTAGSFSAVSRGAGITAGTVAAATSATLDAAGPITVTTGLTAGGAANVTTTAGFLDLVSLRAGASSTLAASGSVTLGNAATTAGDLAVSSTGSNLALAGLDIAGDLTLTAATSITATGPLLAGRAMSIAARNGALTLATLSAGGATTLDATGKISFSTATSAGPFSARSHGAGIAADSIASAAAASLNTAGPIAITTSLIAGGAANIATTGTLDIASLRAGASSSVSASGMVSLGDATTTAGDLAITSTGASVRAIALSAAANLSLTAAGSIEAGALTAGGQAKVEAGGQVRLAHLHSRDGGLSIAAAAIDAGRLQSGTTLALLASGPVLLGSADAGTDLSIHSSAGTISATSLKAGQAVSIDAADALALGSVAAGRGGIVAISRSAGIVAGDLRSGGTATLASFGAVSVERLSAQDTKATASTGSLAIAALNATGSVLLRAGASLSVGRLASTGTADVQALNRITIGTLLAGGDIRLTSTGGELAVSTARSSASAMLTAATDIEVGTITARDALTLLAGRSGHGSISLDHGAAQRLAGAAPDQLRLGRFSAGESIVVMGTRIVADIVQGAGSGLPLALDVSGFRGRSAERVDLAVEAGSFRASRFDAIDARLTTTADRLRIEEAFITGTLALATPHMKVLADNRTLTPDFGYDVQLFSRSRPFYLDLDHNRLTTNAYILRFDSDVAQIPPSVGGSLTRDMARLGAWLTSSADVPDDLPAGLKGGWRGFWNGAGAGEWSNGPFGRPRGFVFPADPGRPPVNLDETEDRP
ncbi:beta strand repeat-containing protein, partial [Bosea rubneri]